MDPELPEWEPELPEFPPPGFKVLFVDCKTCGEEFETGYVSTKDRSDYDTSTFSNIGQTCPNGHYGTYDTVDFHFFSA